MGIGRPGKRSYSPLQRDVLCRLAEAGADAVTTLMNSLPVEDDGESFVSFERALLELESEGLVEFQRPLPLARSGGPRLSERLEPPVDLRALVARSDGMWVASASGEGVEIVLTKKGRDALHV